MPLDSAKQWRVKTLILFCLIPWIFCGELKAKTLELSTGANFYTGDLLRSSTLGNASITYHFNDIFWIGSDFSAGSAHTDRDNGAGILADDALYILGGALYWNLPALLDATIELPRSGISADFYTAIGGGNLWVGRLSTPFGFIGGGLNIDTPLKWLSIKFDLKNIFYALENTKGKSFNSDLGLSIDTSFNF